MKPLLNCLTRLPFALVLLAGSLLGQQPQELGEIDFPNSGAEEAQDAFRRGALLLHSFEYEDAAEAFVEAQRIDPSFALAYWGEALTYSHPIWKQDAPEDGRAALDRYAPSPEERRARAPTERERGLLQAVDVLFGDGERVHRNLAYSAAMQALTARYPDDLDIKALYALSVLGTSEHGRDTRIYMRAASIAEEVYALNPRHPGALHYLIHCYDDPVHAPLGLRMARSYDVVAPAATHALHMPSHIYVALGMWDESGRANVASSAAADVRLERKGLDLDSRGYHALLWLLYTRLQQGRVEEAQVLLEDMLSNHADVGSSRTGYHLSAMQAALAVDTEGWVEQPMEIAFEIDWDDLRLHSVAGVLFAQGLLAARGGRMEEAETVHGQLRDAILLVSQSPGGPDDVAADPSTKRIPGAPALASASDPSACCLPSAVDSSLNPGRRAALVMEKQLEGLILFQRGDHEGGLAILAEACAGEDSMPYDFGPPVVVKPAHELLGEALLQLGRAPAAVEQFDAALSRAPRRARSLDGLEQAASAAGLTDRAREAHAELAKVWTQADERLLTRLKERKLTVGDG